MYSRGKLKFGPRPGSVARALGRTSVFRFFTETVGRFRLFLKKKKNKTEKNETEPEHFPVGFSVGLTVKPTINKNLPGV